MSRSKLSSTDYAELVGLQIALQNLETERDPVAEPVVKWIQQRVGELESRRK